MLSYSHKIMKAEILVKTHRLHNNTHTVGLHSAVCTHDNEHLMCYTELCDNNYY